MYTSRNTFTYGLKHEIETSFGFLHESLYRNLERCYRHIRPLNPHVPHKVTLLPPKKKSTGRVSIADGNTCDTAGVGEENVTDETGKIFAHNGGVLGLLLRRGTGSKTRRATLSDIGFMTQCRARVTLLLLLLLCTDVDSDGLMETG